jgi:hypothetical protein
MNRAFFSSMNSATTKRQKSWLREFRRIAQCLNKENTASKWEVELNKDEGPPEGWPGGHQQQARWRVEIHGAISLLVVPQKREHGPEAIIGVCVREDLQRYEEEKEERPVIQVNYNKGPRRVATDIQRRLLEAGRKHLQTLQERKERTRERYMQMEREAQQVKEKADVELNRGPMRRTFPTGTAHWGHVEQTGPGEYKIDVGGLSVEEAIRVLDVLNQEGPAGEKDKEDQQGG